MAVENASAFEGWAILELMGHRRLVGYLSEQQVAGAGFIRIQVLAGGDESETTQFYAPSAVYAITPCTEETARQAAAVNHVGPVNRWELPAPREERKHPFERADWNDRFDDEDEGDYDPEREAAVAATADGLREDLPFD